VITRGSKRSVSRLSLGVTLTSTTPSIFLHPATTCDAQELHMSAEISIEISWMSAAVAAGPLGALPGVIAGEPQAVTARTSKKKGAKRTFSLCAWRPRSLVG
jgi:hypothetical protein